MIIYSIYNVHYINPEIPFRYCALNNIKIENRNCHSFVRFFRIPFNFNWQCQFALNHKHETETNKKQKQHIEFNLNITLTATSSGVCMSNVIATAAKNHYQIEIGLDCKQMNNLHFSAPSIRISYRAACDIDYYCVANINHINSGNL